MGPTIGPKGFFGGVKNMAVKSWLVLNMLVLGAWCPIMPSKRSLFLEKGIKKVPTPVIMP